MASECVRETGRSRPNTLSMVGRSYTIFLIQKKGFRVLHTTHLLWNLFFPHFLKNHSEIFLRFLYAQLTVLIKTWLYYYTYFKKMNEWMEGVESPRSYGVVDCEGIFHRYAFYMHQEREIMNFMIFYTIFVKLNTFVPWSLGWCPSHGFHSQLST